MRTEMYNPDVLNCLANLSNDEVFTPPSLANQVLDLLPQEVFTSPETTFLDPVSKSGVFLREIVKRLDRGLEPLMPNRRERIEHILKKQVFGIAITELTSHLSRRSVYCSKDASSEYSVTRFATESGNILYSPLHHTWQNGKCRYCGASQEVYDRGNQAEQYAYQFIHTDNPHTLFNKMKFDVIIGNPPYQLSDGSGASTDAANPIYQLFVQQAKSLSSRYLCMIIPSKWMVGGKSVLNKFREDMINDNSLKYICDYENSAACFAGLHIDGGVCYFLRDKQYDAHNAGGVHYVFNATDGSIVRSIRSLKNNYFKYIIRDERILSVLSKTASVCSFSQIVSQTKPYGIRKDLFNNPDKYPTSGLSMEKISDFLQIHGVKGIKGGAKRQVGYVKRSFITSGETSVDKYKIFFTTSYSTNATIPPEVIIADRQCVCTETFLVIGPFETKEEQLNCNLYIHTNFFRFLLYYGKGTMQVNKEVFSLIPLQDFSHPWTDEMLYKKYGLTDEEIAFIESMIRPME